MDDTDLVARVGELRSLGLTPKQIAKTLGVRPAVVEPLLRAHARGMSAAAEPAVVGCWVNRGWSSGLTWDRRVDWYDDSPAPRDHAMPLITIVVVAREHRYGKVSVCAYLVDAQCLGVKDAIGPRVLDRDELTTFVANSYRGHQSEPLVVRLDLAQHLVLGAVEYARQLGFEPHRDFAACRGHLGAWTGPSAIEFGHRGVPRFIQGPHDDAATVLRTLEQSVGRGNFEVVLASGAWM